MNLKTLQTNINNIVANINPAMHTLITLPTADDSLTISELDINYSQKQYTISVTTESESELDQIRQNKMFGNRLSYLDNYATIAEINDTKVTIDLKAINQITNDMNVIHQIFDTLSEFAESTKVEQVSAY